MTEEQKSAMNQAIDLLINKDTDVSTLFKEDGLLNELTKRFVEKALQSEMSNHLGYSKYTQGDNDNARNGYNTNVSNGSKMIRALGEVDKLQLVRIQST